MHRTPTFAELTVPISRVSALFVAFILLSSMAYRASGQTSSTRTLMPGVGDWFEVLAWDSGVPNGPGEEAILLSNPPGNYLLELGSSVALEKLSIAGGGSLQFQGAGPLEFRSDGDGSPTAQILSPGMQASLLVPISLDGSQQNLVNVASLSSLSLEGGILSAGGNLTKRGQGALRLNTANTNWGGRLNIEEGGVEISDVNALVNTDDVRIGPDADLYFVPQDVTGQRNDNYIIPSLTLAGGTIQTKQNSRNVAATKLEADVNLTADSRVLLTTSDIMYFYGSINGTGGVRFDKSPVPGVGGGLSGYPYLWIVGPTSYSGETVVGPDMRVSFELPTLGDTRAGTLVDRGTLTLKGGGGGESITVRQGVVNLTEAVDPYSHIVFLESGNLDGGGDDLPAVLNTHVEYKDGALLGSSASSTNLILAGGISGTGSIAIRNDVEIQGELSARGNLYIRNRSGARLSGPMDLAGEVFVDRQRLELSENIESPEASFRVAPTFEVAWATLVTEVDNTVGRVVLDPRGANREGTFDFASVGAGDNAVLTITDELRFMGGTLFGAIAGQTTLTKQDRSVGVLLNIAGSSFERVNVEAGQLSIQGDAGDSPPEIRLGAHDTGRLIIDDAGIYRGDIYLNNARNDSDVGALSVSGNTTLAGNIYLGDRGSSLSTILSFDEIAEITGAIHGGEFTPMGRQNIWLRSGDHTYIGTTNVQAENFRLADEGRLNSTSMVVGNGRIGPGGGRAGLILDNGGAVALDDRIPDDTPVYLNGMKLTLLGRAGPVMTETLGAVHTGRGKSEIVLGDPSTPTITANLEIEKLIHEPGTVLRFDLGRDNYGKVRLSTAPPLDDGIIGGWALVRGYGFSGDEDFATYGPDGVVAYSDLHTYKTNLVTATSTDNVSLLSQNDTLAGDKNVNALKVRDSDVDLAGHTLTLESGGLLLQRFGDTISAGRLTAGTEAGAELIVSGIGTIAADIVDNAYGSVGLTYASETGNLQLSGNNTYTGPTVLAAGNGNSVELLSETALPVGTDLSIRGTDVRIAYDSDSPLVLGDIQLTDNALLRPSSSNPPPLQPRSIHAESGFISELELVGDFPIVKTGSGVAGFGNSLATHSGPINIEAGVLGVESIGPALLDDNHAVSIGTGGTLDTRGTLDRKVIIDGGVLRVVSRDTLSAPIHISAMGGTIRDLDSRGTPAIDSVITGEGDLFLEGQLGGGTARFEPDLSNFQGDMFLTGGAIAMSRDNSGYSGRIQVANEDLVASGLAPFGSGNATILPEGQLTVGDPLTAELHLKGGVVRMRLNDSLESPVLSGELSVSDHSYLYIVPGFNDVVNDPQILSNVTFEDGSNLVVTELPGNSSDFRELLFRQQASFQSELLVRGSATITSFDSRVNISGTLTPGSPDAVLNLVGNDTFNLTTSVDLGEGGSLSILEDGVPATIDLNSPTDVLSGSGTIQSNINLSSGAQVSPGNSAGVFTVDGDVMVEDFFDYDWEIGDGLGVAGMDWDLLQIQGDLVFAGGSYLNLKIFDLPGLQLRPAETLTIATANNIVGFDPAATQFDILGTSDALPWLTADHVSLRAVGNSLVLQIVPEPSVYVLILCGIVLFAAGKGRLAF